MECKKNYNSRGLCRVPWTRHSAKFFPKKIQKFFAECLGWRTRQSIFFYKTLPSVWAGALGKVFLKIKNKKTLPSAWAAALGKVFFLKNPEIL